ncbi:hypothetical protein [Leptospira weilii]
MEVSYGMQYLIVTSGFDISNLGYNFNLKLVGNQNAESQLATVNQKYEIYKEDIQARIEKQAKANDAEKESKGFLFNVLNGMSGGQKVGQAVEGEIRSRVTGAIAEASGLPASLVGALVGGANMKQAMKAYEKSVTTEAISQATGIPAWYLNQKIAEKEATHAMSTSFSYNMGRSLATMVTAPIQIAAKAAVAALEYTPQGRMIQAASPGIVSQVKEASDNVNKQANKFADHIGQEAYKNRETIDTVVTVAATVAAPLSGGSSLLILGALAAYKTAQGAVEGGVYGALAGAANIGNAFLNTYTGGMVSYNLSYTRDGGFGASVGGGFKVMEGLGVGATLSYNEQSGFGASVGLQAGTSALSFNAGLSYSERDGISGNAGIGLGMGRNATTGSYSSSLNLGVSYNRRDGFGTSAGLSSNNNVVLPGVGATISRSEYGGWGADISTDQYGKVEGGPGRQGFGGVSGGLSWGERDGFTASFNVSGTNAFSYNSQTGLSSNSDFMSQYAMNNALAQGVAQTDEEKAYQARQEAESRTAQNRNNSEQGAAAASGAGYAVAGRRNEGEGGHVTGFGDDGSTPAHGAPSSHGPDQMIASSGSFGPDGESAGGGKRPLSAEDKAAFWDNWKGESRAQTDASIADLKKMGYDTADIEGKVRAYRDGQDSNPAKTTTATTTPTSHPTQSTGFFTNAYNSVVNGAKGLWNSAFGGRTPNGVYNSSGIEAGMDKVLNSKAAYDPGIEPKGDYWKGGKLANGESYSNILHSSYKDANGNQVYEKVYRNYHADGTYTVAGKEPITAATYEALRAEVKADPKGSTNRVFTSCNMVNHEITKAFGAESPFMQGRTQYYADTIYTNLQNGKYDTDTHQYRSVGFEDAEKNASRGGLSIAVNNKHIVTLTGGYTGTQGTAAHLNIFQGGGAGVGPMTINQGFQREGERNFNYFTNGKKLQYYVWEKK